MVCKDKKWKSKIKKKGKNTKLKHTKTIKKVETLIKSIKKQLGGNVLPSWNRT